MCFGLDNFRQRRDFFNFSIPDHERLGRQFFSDVIVVRNHDSCKSLEANAF